MEVENELDELAELRDTIVEDIYTQNDDEEEVKQEAPSMFPGQNEYMYENNEEGSSSGNQPSTSQMTRENRRQY